MLVCWIDGWMVECGFTRRPFSDTGRVQVVCFLFVPRGLVLVLPS